MSSLTADQVEEIKLLALFNVSNAQEGIKVHKAAGSAMVAAAARLHAKGLISQADGGYLTNLGIEAAEHTQALLDILTSAP
ncbi:MAG: TIGR02647 family protein [Gammaproteobacteria bacterium]|jgi:uncharacterized protein (TIGR02647 family)